MNELIKYFNKKYSKKYGKISYPRTTIQIYRVYQSIKSYGINDEELVKLLHNIKLPKPKTIEEKELYADCLYNKDDSEIKIDTGNLVSKENPMFTGSISMGRKEGTAIGENSVAIGKTVEASGECSYAEGKNTTASGWSSHAEGEETKAKGQTSHAEGDNSIAEGISSHAEGSYAVASGITSHAEGEGTKAYGKTSHAEGSFTTASSNYQHVQGKYNIEDRRNKYAHIVGNGKSGMERSNAHTLDWKGNAWYAGQVEGTNLPYNVSSKVLATVSASSIKLDNEITVKNVSINKDKRYYIEFLGVKKLCSLIISKSLGNCIVCAIGNYTIESYNSSTELSIYVSKISQSADSTENLSLNDDEVTTYGVTPSDETIPNATDLVIYEEENKYLNNKYLETDLVLQNSISLGRVGDIGTGSSAIGIGVEASGINSHAEGNVTTASAPYSHAEGTSTTASGEQSHAEGEGTTGSGNSSHAEGFKSTASGNSSHAEGSNTTASGDTSHAEGNNTTASGNNSHVEGIGTIASGEEQHVQGRHNIEDTANKYAHIVGNGSSYYDKSNAHTLDWNGNAWYAGQVEGTNLPYNISSKVLTTIPSNNIKLDDEITINNVSINKDRKYYIEFLGSKKICNLVIDENNGNEISCTIGNYAIEGMIFSSNLMLGVHKINADNTAIDTFTDLVIYEEEIKCLDNKYLENNLRVQNSISLGRVGNIGTGSSAIGMVVEASGMGSHAEGYGAKATGNFSHAEGSGTEALKEDAHAEGNNTIASSMYQHVQGKNNIEDAEGKYAHIVGNGEDFNNRANAHTLDWKGNAWYAGKLSQEGVPTEDKDLITKKYFDDGISSLPQISFNENGELVVTINGVSKIFVPKS